MTETMDIRVRREPYRGWEAWRIERGPLALILVPQVGGRLMGLQWRGQELSYVNPESEGRVLDVAAMDDLRAAKRRLGFPLWGGDKTWLAPQSRWTDAVPFLDLDSGAYALSLDEAEAVATMTSPVCRETGVEIARTLKLDAAPGAWSLTHRLRNRGPRPVTWALWDVAMIVRPATVYLPTRTGSRFPEGVKTFEEEGDSAALRPKVVRVADGVAAIACRAAAAFKYGADAGTGSLFAVLEGGTRGLIGLKKAVPACHPEPYAHDCVVEVYNAGHAPYFELELHGPLVTLAPGESFALEESACLLDLDAPPDPAVIRRLLLTP